MKTILLTNRYDNEPLAIVKKALPEGFCIEFLEEPDEECFIHQISNADYLLAGGRTKVTRIALDNAKKLKMIQRSGVGLDSLDLEAIREKKIPLYVNQGINSESVAEHALMLILASLRRLPIINQRTKNGVWEKQKQGVQTQELRGKTIGIIGMGNIAKALIRLLKPFHVKILYNNLFQEPADFEVENNLHFSTLEELLQNAEIVTIHCALTDQTRNLINQQTISYMKDGAILINTARGPIVDANTVAEALRSGKLAFAGIDVHQQEPFPADYPLINFENTILTPHIGGITADSFHAMMDAAFRNISLFDQGRLDEIAHFRYE